MTNQSIPRLLALAALLPLALSAGAGCRKAEPARGAPPAPPAAVAPEDQPGWFSRLTGLHKTLEERNARLAAAEEAARRAEQEVQAVRVQLDSQRDATQQARRGQSFWRVSSTVVGSLAVVALFAGAAAGSFARQEHQKQQSQPADHHAHA